MTHTRTAFVKTIWQTDAVGKCGDGRVHKPPLEALASGIMSATRAT